VADSKAYDGTTSSAQTPTVGSLYNSDTVTGLSQAFDSRHAGARTLSVIAYTVNDGNGGADYTVHTHTASGTITARDLDLNAVADSKVYDGTTSSAQTPTLGSLYNSDTVTGLSQAFDSRHAGARTLSVTAYTVTDGNGGADYTVHTHTASGTITARDLDIYAVADTKVYDGTTSSSATPTVGTLYNSDTVTGLSQAFDSRHAGFRTLSVTAFTVNDGNGGNDYAVHTHTASGTISKRGLDIYAGTDSKVYDGTTTSTATPTTAGIQTGDSVSGLSQAFQSKNALGTNGSTLQVIGYTVNDGNGGNDYTMHTHTASGTITPAPLTITVNNASKVFGQPNPAFSVSYNSFGGGDSSASLGGALTYTTMATTNSPVGIYPVSASGQTSTNYAITYVPGTLTIVALTGSVYVLDPTAPGAFNISGNASFTTSGNLIVNSSSSTALLASGNASAVAAGIQVYGGFQKSGNASLSPTPLTGVTPVSDPLFGLVHPTASGTAVSVNLSGTTQKTINPGIYSQITVSGSAKLTMNGGVYIIEGGGFVVSGGGSVTGTGVTIFNAGSSYNATTGDDSGIYGAIALTGNGSFKLTASSSGTYKDILIFQPSENTKPLSFSGNAIAMTGTIYAPSAQLVETGNAKLTKTSIIVDLLTLSGNAVTNANLKPPTGTVAYNPAQIRTAYGISHLSWDGKGQTIAIVDAYNNPYIYPTLDTFDSEFGLTGSGSKLYQQYGPAASFLTVLNQDGQSTSLPGTDPSGPGTSNWELEEALDIEWVHAIAPGAQIILVEANSDSLSDLMAAVATAASQPGVSVVSMSWGYLEGQDVSSGDEATYDSVFNVPGVTFIASTGDNGADAPEYPAFSPNVVAVGGTSLTLNADNSYNTETGWGFYSDTRGPWIGSGGGISQNEAEPAYQQGVHALGTRTIPDVSFAGDPLTGAWIADTYNLDSSNPYAVVGGTSWSAPAWAALLALVNQGRIAGGQSILNASSPTEVQDALYILPQTDYNVINSGSNGYTAGPGYNLVTGLGTPIANLLVPDLIAYQPGSTYSGPTVGPLQDTYLVSTNPGGGDSGGGSNALGLPTLMAYGPGATSRTAATHELNVQGQSGAAGSQIEIGVPFVASPVSASQNASTAALGSGTNAIAAGLMPRSSTGVTTARSVQGGALVNAPSFTRGSTNLMAQSTSAQQTAGASVRPALDTPTGWERSITIPRTHWVNNQGLVLPEPRTGPVLDSALHELAADAVLLRGEENGGSISDLALTTAGAADAPLLINPPQHQDPQGEYTEPSARLSDILLAAGFCSFGAGLMAAGNPKVKNLPSKRRFLKFRPRV
jgi:hypothetical protein